jgi:hypothetical protein
LYVSALRPFVVITTFSTGLVGVDSEELQHPQDLFENVVIKMPTGQKHTNIRWDDGGK